MSLGLLWWILMCAAFYAGSRWGRARLKAELRHDRVPHLITCHCAHCLNELYQRTGQ